MVRGRAADGTGRPGKIPGQPGSWRP